MTKKGDRSSSRTGRRPRRPSRRRTSKSGGRRDQKTPKQETESQARPQEDAFEELEESADIGGVTDRQAISELNDDDVEFLDEDLLVEENTGEVAIGQIGATPGAVEDFDEEENATEAKHADDLELNEKMSGGSDRQNEAGDDEQEGEAVTRIRSEGDLARSGKVQRLDLEDLNEMETEGEDMSFLDRPTAEVELRQEPDLMDEERRDPLRVADGFNTQESWDATGEHTEATASDPGAGEERLGMERDEDLDKTPPVGVAKLSAAEIEATDMASVQGGGTGREEEVVGKEEIIGEEEVVGEEEIVGEEEVVGEEEIVGEEDLGGQVKPGDEELAVGDEAQIEEDEILDTQEGRAPEEPEEPEESEEKELEPTEALSEAGIVGAGAQEGGAQETETSRQDAEVAPSSGTQAGEPVADAAGTASETPSAQIAEAMGGAAIVEPVEAEVRAGDLGLDALGDLPAPEDGEGGETPPWETDRTAFQEQAHRLALRRRWEALALLTRQALVRAPWAQEGPAKAALLLDLGRIYKDRLSAPKKACIVFEALLKEDPSSRNALDFLAEYYEEVSDWRSLFSLYLASVESTWDPGERLERTSRAAEIAEKRLQDTGRAIQAWERLWRLGGGLHQVRAALTQLYRDGGQWKALAAFLSEDAQGLEPADRTLQLREVVELCLYGAGDLDRARSTVERLLEADPTDPIALLARAEVLARVADWDALLELLGSAEEELEQSSALNLMRWAADALWKGGRKQEATGIYRKVLDQRPDDEAAAHAVEAALDKAGQYEELVNLLEARLERAADPEEQAGVLAKLARVADERLQDADRAVGYWKKRAEVLEGDVESYQALSALYEKQEKWEPLTTVLGEELELRRDPSGKRDLLSRMGQVFAQRLADDERAESAWRRMLVLDPEDGEARRELMALHRRRGEYEALDKALIREINLADDAVAVDLCREAAKNVEENIQDPARALEAWFRVLDRRPSDTEALSGVTRVLEETKQPLRLGTVLERRLEEIEEIEARVALGLRTAAVWRELDEEGRNSAAAVYERVLRWSAGCLDALLGLCELNLESGDVARALSIVDFGLLSLESVEQQAALCRQVAAKLPESNNRERYGLLRRVALLSSPDGELLDMLDGLARETQLEEDFLSLLEEVVDTVTPAQRVRLRERAASICTESLKKENRAFLELEQYLVARQCEGAYVEALRALSEKTERHEEMYALLGGLVREGSDTDAKVALLETRCRHAEQKLDDGVRAFLQIRRALSLQPQNEKLLQRALELAEKYELWNEMEALYGQLLLQAEVPSKRMELARARHDLQMEHLDDRLGAFHQLVLMYRLSGQESLEAVIGKAADQLSQWDYWLPVLEARLRTTADDEQQAVRLAELATSYDQELDDGPRALVICCLALEKAPEQFEELEQQRNLAGQHAGWPVFVDTVRLAAGRCEDAKRKLALLEQAAAIEEEQMDNHAGSVEVHRRILALHPSAMDSLEVCLAHQRENGDQEALQQRLQQWIQHAPKEADRVERFLELARLAEQGRQPEKALLAYTQILEIQPDHEEARSALEKMADRLSPEQKLRKMKLEMRSAEGRRAIELHLALAKHQNEVLGDRRGAIQTLRDLTELEGLDGKGQALLSRLLREEEMWDELADLAERRAEALEAPEAKLESLEEALRVRLEHLRDEAPERVETVCRKILELRPEDSQAGVLLLHTLRSQGRYTEMAALLERSSASLTDPDDRFWALFELARIQQLALGDPDEAKRVYGLLEETDKGKNVARLALARLAAEREDWPGYLRWREAHAKTLDDKTASLAYCHLAEVADEKLKHSERILGYYRRARILDEENDLARQALKALGRRVKEWRRDATLLADADSAELTFSQRADRLAERARAFEDEKQKVEGLWRALVVDPDRVGIWDELAQVLGDRGELEESASASLQALEAFQRGTSPGHNINEEVERFHACSRLAVERGWTEEAERLERHAYELDPADARAALAVANERFADGDVRGAGKIYRELVAKVDGGAAGLDEEMRADVTYRLGQAALKLGDPQEAVKAFEETLELQPLHGGALVSLGRELGSVERAAESARMYLRALTVADAPSTRATINSQLGALLEDALARLDEAGACYRRALDEGATDLETLWRSLKYAQKTGRHGQALDLISEMLDKVEDPEDMAGLWVTRGQIYASQSGKEDQAVEAFDMALSYDPGCNDALQGLSGILERRGEWDQLIEVLEATQQLLPPEEQANVLVRMAEISRKQFEDPEREEGYLRMAAQTKSNREILTRLQEIYGAQPDRLEEQKMVLGKLVAHGPPYFEHVVELGKRVLDEGKRRWAWCLLSPLSEVRKIEKELKSSLREMRKEFDGVSVTTLNPEDRSTRIRHPLHDAKLEEVLSSVAEAVGTFGPTTLEDATQGTPSKIGKSTGLGRVLNELCGVMDLPDREAWRVDELDEPIRAVALKEGPKLLLQADFARKLVQNEVRFVFGIGLELTRPGNLTLTSAEPATRVALMKGLFGALGWQKARGSKPKELEERLRENVDEDTLAVWRDAMAPLRAFDPEQLAERQIDGIYHTARRIGLLMSGELHLSLRALERMAGHKIGRQVDHLADLDTRIEAFPERADLLSFACSATFCELLNK